MKTFLLFTLSILWLVFSVFAADATPKTITASSSNGSLLWPTNFFSANSNSIWTVLGGGETGVLAIERGGTGTTNAAGLRGVIGLDAGDPGSMGTNWLTLSTAAEGRGVLGLDVATPGALGTNMLTQATAGGVRSLVGLDAGTPGALGTNLLTQATAAGVRGLIGLNPADPGSMGTNWLTLSTAGDGRSALGLGEWATNTNFGLETASTSVRFTTAADDTTIVGVRFAGGSEASLLSMSTVGNGLLLTEADGTTPFVPANISPSGVMNYSTLTGLFVLSTNGYGVLPLLPADPTNLVDGDYARVYNRIGQKGRATLHGQTLSGTTNLAAEVVMVGPDAVATVDTIILGSTNIIEGIAGKQPYDAQLDQWATVGTNSVTALGVGTLVATDVAIGATNVVAAISGKQDADPQLDEWASVSTNSVTALGVGALVVSDVIATNLTTGTVTIGATNVATELANKQAINVVADLTALGVYSGSEDTVMVTDLATGGTFARTTGLAADGVIVVSNTVSDDVFKRQFSGPIDPRWFGLVMDDATKTAENHTAITNACAILNAAGKGSIEFPAGVVYWDIPWATNALPDEESRVIFTLTNCVGVAVTGNGTTFKNERDFDGVWGSNSSVELFRFVDCENINVSGLHFDGAANNTHDSSGWVGVAVLGDSHGYNVDATGEGVWSVLQVGTYASETSDLDGFPSGGTVNVKLDGGKYGFVVYGGADGIDGVVTAYDARRTAYLSGVHNANLTIQTRDNYGGTGVIITDAPQTGGSRNSRNLTLRIHAYANTAVSNEYTVGITPVYDSTTKDVLFDNLKIDISRETVSSYAGYPIVMGSTVTDATLTLRNVEISGALTWTYDGGGATSTNVWPWLAFHTTEDTTLEAVSFKTTTTDATATSNYTLTIPSSFTLESDLLIEHSGSRSITVSTDGTKGVVRFPNMQLRKNFPKTLRREYVPPQSSSYLSMSGSASESSLYTTIPAIGTSNFVYWLTIPTTTTSYARLGTISTSSTSVGTSGLYFSKSTSIMVARLYIGSYTDFITAQCTLSTDAGGVAGPVSRVAMYRAGTNVYWFQNGRMLSTTYTVGGGATADWDESIGGTVAGFAITGSASIYEYGLLAGNTLTLADAQRISAVGPDAADEPGNLVWWKPQGPTPYFNIAGGTNMSARATVAISNAPWLVSSAPKDTAMQGAIVTDTSTDTSYINTDGGTTWSRLHTDASYTPSKVTAQRTSLAGATKIVDESGDAIGNFDTGWTVGASWTTNSSAVVNATGATNSLSHTTVTALVGPPRFITMTLVSGGAWTVDATASLTVTVGGSLMRTFANGSEPSGTMTISGMVDGTTDEVVFTVYAPDAKTVSGSFDNFKIEVLAAADYLHRHTYPAAALVKASSATAPAPYFEFSAAGTHAANGNAKDKVIALVNTTVTSAPAILATIPSTDNNGSWRLKGKVYAAYGSGGTDYDNFMLELDYVDGSGTYVTSLHSTDLTGDVFAWNAAGYFLIGANADTADGDVTINTSSVEYKP